MQNRGIFMRDEVDAIGYVRYMSRTTDRLYGQDDVQLADYERQIEQLGLAQVSIKCQKVVAYWLTAR